MKARPGAQVAFQLNLAELSGALADLGVMLPLVLALGLFARLIVAAAWWNAALFLLMAWTRADRLIARLFPKPVVRGIQLGLAVLLGRSAWSLIRAPDTAWQPGLIIAGATIPWV